MYTLEGVSSVANFITAYEESRLKPPSEILFTDRSKAVLLSWFIFVIVRL